MKKEIKLSVENTSDYVWYLYGRGRELMNKNEYALAYDYFLSAYEKAEKLEMFETEKEETLMILEEVANTAANAGKYQDALKYRQKHLQILKKYHKKDTEEIIYAMDRLATIYENIGNDEEEFKLREIIYFKSKDFYGETSEEAISAGVNYRISHSNFPGFKKKLKKLDESFKNIAEKILDEYCNSPNYKDEKIFNTVKEKVLNLTNWINETEDEEKSNEFNKKLLDLAREVYSQKNSPELIPFLDNATLYVSNEECYKFCKEAFEIKKANAKTDEDMISAWQDYLRDCELCDKEAEKRKAEKEVSSIRKNILEKLKNKEKEVTGEELVKILKEESDVLHDLEDIEGEIACQRKIVEVVKAETLEESLQAKEKIAELLSVYFDKTESIEILKEVWNIRVKNHDSYDNLFSVLFARISVCRDFEKYEEALSVIKEGIEKIYASASPKQAMALKEGLIDCLDDLELYDEELKERTLLSVMYRDYYGKTSGVAAEIMAEEASVAKKAGKLDYALKLRKEIIEIFIENYGEFSIYTVEEKLRYIATLCLADNVREALELTQKINLSKPMLVSNNFLYLQQRIQATIDACLLLINTNVQEFQWEKEIREETLNLLSINWLSGIFDLKQKTLINFWKEAYKKDFKSTEEKSVPWKTEKEYGRDGFWIKVLTKDLMLYYADGYKDYIFYDEIGWEEFGFQPKLGHDIDYDKISEDEVLEYVWEHQCNIKMFFSPRPWE